MRLRFDNIQNRKKNMKKGIQYFLRFHSKDFCRMATLWKKEKMIERKCTDQFMFPKTTDGTQDRRTSTRIIYVSAERKKYEAHKDSAHRLQYHE